MDRFWDKVQKTDNCWIWIGAGGKNSYGNSYYKGKYIKAHRLSWVLTCGEIPKGLSVCHTCDNRRCVRPDHLFLGSQADNMRDMRQKNRGPKGESHGMTKLSLEKVLEIKTAVKNGCTQRSLVSKYGISPAQIHRIVTGKRWSHLAAGNA